MKVKIDTKEKFHVITLREQVLSANMTEELSKMLLPFLKNEIKNVILKLDPVKKMHEAIATTFLNMQQTFYDNKASFVICGIQKTVQETFNKLKLSGIINVTPTESEAWDIVQMEEIEREFLD